MEEFFTPAENMAKLIDFLMKSSSIIYTEMQFESKLLTVIVIWQVDEIMVLEAMVV